MKTQVVSILLSALLCSTLAHEYLRAKHLSGHGKHLQHHGKHHLASRAQSTQTCAVECTAPTITGDLEFHLSADLNLAGVLNVTANLALAVDISANIVVLLNGNTGAAVAIDIATGSGVTISTGIWVAASVSFSAYFSTLTSLKAILSAAGAVSFTLKTIAAAQLQLILTIVAGLVGALQVVVADALTVAINLGSELVGVLKVIVGLLSAGVYAVKGSIIVLINILTGVERLVVAVTGGVAALVAADVKLKLAILLAGISGIEALISILVDISEKVGLEIVQIASSEVFITIVAALGGGVINGSINGVLNLLANIVLLAQGKVTIDGFLNVAIGVALSIETDISAQLTTDLNLLLTLSEVTGLTAVVNALLAGTATIGGVVVSKVIAALEAGASAALTVVVGILVAISGIVSVASSVATLATHLVGLIASKAGAIILAQLLGIQVGANLLITVIKSLNLSVIAGLVWNFDANIQKVAIIGPIYVALKAAIANVGVSVNIVSAISSTIQAFLSLVLSGGNLIGSALGISANKGALDVVAGVSISFSANLTVAAAASS